MVGLEWTIGNETEQLLNVRMCSSADGCNSLCKDNLIDVRQEKFVAWADLTRQRLRLEARRTDGVLLYNTSFDTHKKSEFQAVHGIYIPRRCQRQRLILP